MLGMHDNHDELTHYRLDRVRNLRLSEDIAVPIENRLGENALSLVRNKIATQVAHFGGEETRIVLEYTPGQIPNAILYDLAGDEVRVKKMKDGRMRATFCKQNSITLRGWLLQYAGMFKVIFKNICFAVCGPEGSANYTVSRDVFSRV